MIKAKYLSSKDDISAVINVRASIDEFCERGRDSYDDMAIYALAYDDAGVECGCGRLFIDCDSHFRIDTLGVKKTMRGHGVGDLLARMLLYRAKDLNAASIHAFSPNEIAPFFKRYGFLPASDKADEHGVSLIVTSGGLTLEGACSRAANGCSGDCVNCKNA